MSPQTPPSPENNNINPEIGYSLKPLFFGSGIMCALLIASFWVYIEHPEWLEASNSENDQVEKILEANPDLSREDLEADAQTGDLSFWLRTDPGNSSQVNNNQAKKNKEADPLEVFMKKQKEEDKQKQKDSASKNPLLNLSPLEDLTNAGDAKKKGDGQIGTLNLDALSLSTPLDRMLRGEAGNGELTPLEAELLSLQQLSPTSTTNTPQPQEQNNRGTNNPNSNANSSPNQTPNNPNNLLPNATNNLYSTPSGLSSNQRRTTAQPSINQTTRRGTSNPALNGVGANGVNTGVNGVVPTTPIVPQNSRRGVVSPRVSTPTTTTFPGLGNTSPGLNDPYSRSQQQQQQQQPTQTNRAVNPNNRIGGGEINSFSNPYGTGQ
ncbi:MULTISPECIES: hypothetical protein [Spirulina sp. CCY15215]|uniref:hypothetical protein n=1 Tax=Spirulina sp. CCY15215 TaxID=2767591 RepID=UPI00194EA868|nr:hypothetical protein [Spirulina major]